MQTNPKGSNVQNRDLRGFWIVTSVVTAILLAIIAVFLLTPPKNVGPVTPTANPSSPNSKSR
jgi:hypothetical protein